MLLTVEDTENRATLKLARAVEEVKKLLVPVVRKFQLHYILPLPEETITTATQDEYKKRDLSLARKFFFFFFVPSLEF